MDIEKVTQDTTSDELLKTIEHYLQLGNKVFENELVQLIGSSSKALSFIGKSRELIIRKKFNAFLNGFSENEQPTKRQLEKLVNYIDDESKAEFISDTISKIILSNSSKSCLLIGTLIKSLVNEGRGIDHEKLVCITALTDFYDIDIRNYKEIFDYVEWKKSKYSSKKIQQKPTIFTIDYNHSLKDYAKNNNLNFPSLILTLEKSINNQLISKSYEAEIDVEYDKDIDMSDVSSDINIFYNINSPGIILENYIRRNLPKDM